MQYLNILSCYVFYNEILKKEYIKLLTFLFPYLTEQNKESNPDTFYHHQCKCTNLVIQCSKSFEQTMKTFLA